MIITIDGPAGAGKSTAARALARRLGFAFLDTGAMYRAVTFAALRDRVDFADQAALEHWLPTLSLELEGEMVRLNGEEIGGLLRTPEITRHSRAAADNPAVRKYLGELQRRFALNHHVVTEGRDQGTMVFPDADCKFFLQADPEARARRRHRELLAKGETIAFDEVRKAQAERDARDAARTIAPMVPARDAILIDSTAFSATEVVELMEQKVRERNH